MTTKKYFYILAISTSTFLIHSCNKSEKIENSDKTEEVASTEIPSLAETEPLSDETKSDAETVSTDTKNVDKMLDDYEEYVDKYIVYAKKIQTGDMSAMKEYTESMEKIKDDEQVTPEQMKRMMEIQTKMAGTISTK